MQYTSREVRQKFIEFYKKHGHAQIEGTSIVPKEDPTVLFNTAGMQPLIPYLMGQVHPQGQKLVNSQKCLRTNDIEEVGDNRHCTFFEMLGTWSLGDYFKDLSIELGFEFLTSSKWLGIDPKRLFVTVYKGNGKDVAADEEAIEAWKIAFGKVGIKAEVGEEYDFKNLIKNKKDAKYIYRITRKSGKDNWWGLPYRGPCGPCSEVYYLLNQNEVIGAEDYIANLRPTDAEKFIDDQIIEIWNHVFMQYEGEKTENDEPQDLKPLKSKNIDTGMGFERLLTVLNGLDTVYKTDVLEPIVKVAERWANTK